MGLTAQRLAWLVSIALGVHACSARTHYAQTASEPAAVVPDASTPPVPIPDATVPPPPLPEAGPDTGVAAPSCPSSLADRLSVTTYELDVDVRYKRRGYDNIAMDERVAFGVVPDGSAHVAWIENASGNIRVTPLDTQLRRRGPDVRVQGADIGGFAAREDGFALLTRRDDPGEPLADLTANGLIAKAAVLVRVRGGEEVFAAPLTGTESITRTIDPEARDCSPLFLYGRLAWNGSKYGAYILVHGCEGDPHETNNGDKLVYADDEGRLLSGGWGWNCSKNQGLRLLPSPDVFTSVCLSDERPYPGLNLVIEGRPPRQLAQEMYANGYVAGAFGSIVRMADGSYVVGWLSRGVTSNAERPTAAKMANDIAMLRLGSQYESLGPRVWLLETADRAEANLHIAPYGSERLFVSWDSIADIRCDNGLTCFGRYDGTFARLSDLEGNFLTPQTRIGAVPNTGEDIAVFPNRDLGWAYVPEDDRSYSGALPVDRNGVARVPAKRQLAVARLRYCP